LVTMLKFMICALMVVVGIGCAGAPRQPAPAIENPGEYNICFRELDADGNGEVSSAEFQQRFPQAGGDVLKTMDTSGDGVLDHAEWHAFLAAHGISH